MACQYDSPSLTGGRDSSFADHLSANSKVVGSVVGRLQLCLAVSSLDHLVGMMTVEACIPQSQRL